MNKYIAIIVLSLASFVAKGQGETVIIVNYLPAISLGETAEFTNNFSPRGVDFEVNYFLSEDLSVGFVSSWNIFREKIVGESFEYDDLIAKNTFIYDILINILQIKVYELKPNFLEL